MNSSGGSERDKQARGFIPAWQRDGAWYPGCPNLVKTRDCDFLVRIRVRVDADRRSESHNVVVGGITIGQSLPSAQRTC